SVPGFPERGDGRAGLKLYGSVLQIGRELVDDAAQASGHSQKERPSARSFGRRLGTAPPGKQAQGAGHAFLADESTGDLRGNDGERELVDPAGVDAAEQRIDE